MDTPRHRDQMNLLIESLRLGWADRHDFYVGGNMFLYFSLTQSRRVDHRGPDVFVVLDTTDRERRSWVVWEEDGKAPDVVVELTSDSTRHVDHGLKKDIYARLLRVPNYFIFDPFSKDLVGYQLRGDEYVEIPKGEAGDVACPALSVTLGIRHGEYNGIETGWLRWVTAEGELFPSMAEKVAAEAQRATAEAQRAEAATQRAETEAARRREAEAEVARLQAELARLRTGSA